MCAKSCSVKLLIVTHEICCYFLVYFSFLILLFHPCCPRILGFVEAISTAAHFITVPKNKEVFVGDSVQFNWDYKDDKAEIISIEFGISDNDRGRKLINILDKSPKSGIVRFQVQIPLEKRERIESVEDTRASFKIKNVKMNDTGYYFCSLRPDTWEKSEKTSIVFMRVVGKSLTKTPHLIYIKN